MRPVDIVDPVLALLAAAVAGAVGGIIHFAASGEPKESGDRWWKGCLTGLVAALGALYALAPTSAEKLIALSTVSGYLARSVLAALEARVKVQVAQQQRDRAVLVAKDTITAFEKCDCADPTLRPPGAAIAELRARIAEIQAPPTNTRSP